MNKKISRITLLSLFSFLVACQHKFVEDDNHQINTIVDQYPIRKHEKKSDLQQVNVIDLDKITKCGQDRAVLSPASLNISTKAFDKLWHKLIVGMSQEKYYIFTYGNCTEDGPIIKKITECSIDSCGKDFVVGDDSIIWIGTWTSSLGEFERPREHFNEYIFFSRKSSASFYVKTPLEYDENKKAWKFKIMYAGTNDVVAVDGYMNDTDFKKGKFIETTGYNIDGSILFHYTNYDKDGYVIH